MLSEPAGEIYNIKPHNRKDCCIFIFPLLYKCSHFALSLTYLTYNKIKSRTPTASFIFLINMYIYSFVKS